MFSYGFSEYMTITREKQQRKPDFLTLVMITILAVIAGAVGWEDLKVLT